MKNIIEFFYNIEIERITLKNNKYLFYVDNYLYIFEEYKYIKNLQILLETQRYNCFHKIIYNKNNEIITICDNNNYILLKSNILKNRNINMNDIIELMSMKIFSLYPKVCYKQLWENKIDKFEEFIKNKKNEIKFREYYDYYIGLGENAIRYCEYIKEENIRYCFTYKRISNKDTLIELYDPTNIIIAPAVRGIAEYLKNAFLFDKDVDIFILNKINFSNEEIVLLISRLLFPTYFFDTYNKKDYNKLKKIINNSHKYEKYVYYLIKKFKESGYDIPIIKWLNN